MLHYETIHPNTLDLLKKIQSLDLFGTIDASLEEIADELSGFADVKPLSSSKSMRFLVVDDVKVDIVNYPYKWIDEPAGEDGIILAGIKDIAAMKLSAITNRGTKKDFIDLFFLLKSFSLNELLTFYLQKYSDAQLFTVLKSLTYFEDAEDDPMPMMTESIIWRDVKTTIIGAVSRYLG